MDNRIITQIRKRQIAGLSLAVINGGKIVKVQGYGVTDKDEETPVTPATLFQAGSVSKTVAAFGALHLVAKGKLSLDTDANAQLSSWKLPDNEFTNKKKVTVRDILSHSAGLTIHGFPGYSVERCIPTLREILDGVKPANTAAVRVNMFPGSKSRYSGGGYTVLQQMVIDATCKPYAEFMRDTVLLPLGMMSSTYEQPLPQEMVPMSATGYGANGKVIAGRWHIYPEMAAAGLWTTASDLAQFAIGVQQSLSGISNHIISQSLAQQMITRQKDNFGFGVFLEGTAEKLRFYHGGRNRGFDALLMAYANKGDGVVILSNTNDESGGIREIVKIIAKEYHWS